MALGGKLYGLTVSAKTAADGAATTKTISGLNIPVITTENENAIARDLRLFAQRLNTLTTNTYQSTTLTSKQEVT